MSRTSNSTATSTADRKKEGFLSQGPDWSFDLIQQYDEEIGAIAADFGLDTYPNQIEIISSEQMMDAYASVGMPLGYNHWSYGKQFLEVEQNYKRGRMGLAYEIVINSSPCIAYLMEENNMMMQALVIAHACYGHNSFFKGNYLFKTWTDATAIIDYLVFAKKYVQQCEEKYGIEEVELTLDSCHALMNFGVDRYKRPIPLSIQEEKARQDEREKALQQQVNDLWRTIPNFGKSGDAKHKERIFPEEPQENLLYFLEKNAPLLKPWQRELIRIVRKMAQYFYPQRQTQVMNEGWASFWHYTLMNELYNRGKVNEGFILEFLQSHTNVVYQPEFDSPYYSGVNPYALGFAIYTDIKRMCENPTDEDRHWFPDIAGADWLKTLDFAMRNFKDESFILQFLSPKVMRDFRFFGIENDVLDPFVEVKEIHNEDGFQRLRQRLAQQYNLSYREPNIQVQRVNIDGDRSVVLRHVMDNDRPLNKDTVEVMRHFRRLWGFDVRLESWNAEGQVQTYACGNEES
ncbi:SpoVR family protein [Marinomonas balearica]|uniref:Spore cortex formation protein SpoVR/YcgB (Stage V sporulation) n=1 Tax=Marinomonas balearica TaxID=491947 RepID=A0A4R6MF94_9GAMM|nr:SpoVR family protein [Marinomonas balearica]TDO98759.1 spore cortex formation protein SpoVR/YcgB (stage V sporulation) [Marinomonas balearica]